jgi:mRNA interferase RelE/StbE
MAWFRLVYHPTVIDDLGAIDASTAQRLFDKTKWLASNVDNLRHEPVAQDLPGVFKYAVGDWRIFYAIDRDEHLMEIRAIVRRAALQA